MEISVKRIMRNSFLAAAALAAAVSFTSCNSDDPGTLTEVPWTYTFETTGNGSFTAEGYWTQVYDLNISNISYNPNLILTHKANTDYYDGQAYTSWTGFCPSRSTDNADQGIDGDWTAHQWGSITGGGADGSKDYQLCYWDTRESLSLDLMTTVPSVAMTLVSQAADGCSTVQSVRITNSAYGYYAMLNGTPFSAAFTDTDWCKLIIYGVRNGQRVGDVEFYLARNGNIVDTWETVDLSSLGRINAIYIQMESSQSGQFGMNNPSYFCLDDLKLTFERYQ